MLVQRKTQPKKISFKVNGSIISNESKYLNKEVGEIVTMFIHCANVLQVIKLLYTSRSLIFSSNFTNYSVGQKCKTRNRIC